MGFGARSLDDSEPKYLNSPESPIYQKGRVLYGLSWARDAIRREGRVVLMEGYLDVARALEEGIEEAVATCGTALTASHARLLRRFAETVCVNFDQDEAGQRAARKGMEVLLGEGLRVRVVELPEGHDPDSFLKAEGGDAYRRRIDEAPEALEWLMRQAERANDLGAPEGKAGFFSALLPALVRIDNAVERSAWLARAVERGGLDEAAAREELRRALGGRGAGGAAVAEAARRAPAREGPGAHARGAVAPRAGRAGRGGRRRGSRRAGRGRPRRAAGGAAPAGGQGDLAAGGAGDDAGPRQRD